MIWKKNIWDVRLNNKTYNMTHNSTRLISDSHGRSDQTDYCDQTNWVHSMDSMLTWLTKFTGVTRLTESDKIPWWQDSHGWLDKSLRYGWNTIWTAKHSPVSISQLVTMVSARNFHHHLLQPYHGNHQHQQPRPPSSSLLNLLQTSLPFLGCLAEKNQ